MSIKKITILLIVSMFFLASCWEAKKENNEEEIFTWSTISVQQVENKSIMQKYFEKTIWSLKCTLHMEEEGWVVDQTFYISWIKMRNDVKTTYEWNESESHMISDWEYTYIWGTGGSFKMKVDDSIYDEVTEEEKNQVDTENRNDMNDMKTILSKIPNNKCVEWNEDSDMFELPEWIEFIDMEEMMKGLWNIENMIPEWLGQ